MHLLSQAACMPDLSRLGCLFSIGLHRFSQLRDSPVTLHVHCMTMMSVHTAWQQLDHHAACAGGAGVTGRNLAQHLEKCGDYDVIYAVARRPITFGTDTVSSMLQSVCASTCVLLDMVASPQLSVCVQIKGLSLDLQRRDKVIETAKKELQNVTHVW